MNAARKMDMLASCHSNPFLSTRLQMSRTSFFRHTATTMVFAPSFCICRVGIQSLSFSQTMSDILMLNNLHLNFNKAKMPKTNKLNISTFYTMLV